MDEENSNDRYRGTIRSQLFADEVRERERMWLKRWHKLDCFIHEKMWLGHMEEANQAVRRIIRIRFGVRSGSLNSLFWTHFNHVSPKQYNWSTNYMHDSRPNMFHSPQQSIRTLTWCQLWIVIWVSVPLLVEIRNISSILKSLKGKKKASCWQNLMRYANFTFQNYEW